MTFVSFVFHDDNTKNPGAMTNDCICWIVVTAFCDGALMLETDVHGIYLTTMILAPTRHSAHAIISDEDRESYTHFTHE